MNLVNFYRRVSKAMVCDTARIRPGFKTGNIFIFLNFISSISSILPMHKCFPLPEGCEGIFTNQKSN